jgi:hypothetical protein
LTAESTGQSIAEEYYWTPEARRILTKVKLSKRALIGVVGVQGSGKTAAMYAVANEILGEDGFDSDNVIGVKVAETGSLEDSFKAALGDTWQGSVDSAILEWVEFQIATDHGFSHKAVRIASRTGDQEMMSQIRRLLHGGEEVKHLCSGLLNMVPRRGIREEEAATFEAIIENQRLILIDMPDYPKHDRRLIARDLDDIQGLWNRLMASPDSGNCQATLVVFIQKETFNHADHFLYGKMDLISLMPLNVSQLLEAYKQKWGTYEPFNDDALQYIARMSRGVFRRFKRYIGLAVEAWMPTDGEPKQSIDLELVKSAVTDEEIMRDMDKEFDGIFRKQDQKQKALFLIRLLAEKKASRERSKAAGYKSFNDMFHSENPEPEGTRQGDLAEKLGLTEMEFSRLVRELEQHGYVKRTPWQQWKYVDLNW